MDGVEKSPETTQRRAVYDLQSCKESVFGKMLANETARLCQPYLQYDKVPVTKCTIVL